MNIDFSNKTIIITGATRGIGKQIADDLFNLNAKIIITGTKEIFDQKDYSKDLKRVQYFKSDFTKKEDLENFIKEINKIDNIYGLVNNAGINILNSIDNILFDDWMNMLSVNLTAPLMLMNAVSNKMLQSKTGRIINISSIFGKISKEKRGAYSATKAGLHGMTQGVSNDLAKYNILVNSISPGFIKTDLTKKNLSNSQINDLENLIPQKRLGDVKEVSKLAIFLLSEFNTYITGQNIIIDGGFTNV